MGLPSLHDRVGGCRPHCRRKPRLNRPIASTGCGTRCAGRTFSSRPTDAAAPIAARRAWTARRSRTIEAYGAGASGWKSCGRSYGPGRTGRGPCCVSRSPKRRRPAAARHPNDPRSGGADGNGDGARSRSSRRTCCRSNTAIRPGCDAKMAVRRVHWHIAESGAHGGGRRGLERVLRQHPARSSCCSRVARRVEDRHAAGVIKSWLEMPVVESDERGRRRTERGATGTRAGGRRKGAPCSPLLGNLYMRRFLLGWKRLGHEPARCSHRQLRRRLRDLLPAGNGGGGAARHAAA